MGRFELVDTGNLLSTPFVYTLARRIGTFENQDLVVCVYVNRLENIDSTVGVISCL